MQDKQNERLLNVLRKVGPYYKQILNYSYPPLLYQRNEDDSELLEGEESEYEFEEEDSANSHMLGDSGDMG